MLINNIFLILIILFLTILFLEYFYINIVEGFMTVVGPVIRPQGSIKYTPTNTYYENKKITQDFDKDAVLQDFTPNSIIIQEDPEYVLTN